MGTGWVTGWSLQPHSRDLGNILIISRDKSHCNEVLLCQHGAPLSRAVKVFQCGNCQPADILFGERTWIDLERHNGSGAVNSDLLHGPGTRHTLTETSLTGEGPTLQSQLPPTPVLQRARPALRPRLIAELRYVLPSLGSASLSTSPVTLHSSRLHFGPHHIT